MTLRTGKHSKKDNEAVKKFIRNMDLSEKPLCDEYEGPEKEKQRMLHNLKADDIAMIIVKQKRLDSCQHKAVYKKVLQKVYHFLIKLVRQNKLNQEHLYPFVGNLFFTDIQYGLGATQLIGEILRNN